MNFFGLLWVISAVSSFFSPHESPRTLEYFSRTISHRSIALISRVTSARFPASVRSVSSFWPNPLGNQPALEEVVLAESFPSSASGTPASLPNRKGALSKSAAGQGGHSRSRFQSDRLYFPVRRIVVPPYQFCPYQFWHRSLVSITPSMTFPSSVAFWMVSHYSGQTADLAHLLQRGRLPASTASPKGINTLNLRTLRASGTVSTLVTGLSPQAPVLASKDLSNPVLQVVSHLFRWSGDLREAFRFTTPLVTVVPAQNPCLVTPTMHRRWSYASRHGIRDLTLGQCTQLWRRDPTLTEPVEVVYQVRVKDQLVAELPTAERAEGLARRLQQVLRNSDFDPTGLSPTLINGMPAGKADDTVLFWVEPEIATLLDRNAELLAIAWINNLRDALDVPEISLTEAQSQMHRLIPTNRRIQGTASWYGPHFHGRLTATGEIFNQTDLTAAHPTLPFNTYLKVTNLLTGKSLIVRINDRGPYFEDRSLDLSREAARYLDSEVTGIVPYEAVIMENAELAQVKKNTRSLSASLTQFSR